MGVDAATVLVAGVMLAILGGVFGWIVAGGDGALIGAIVGAAIALTAATAL